MLFSDHIQSYLSLVPTQMKGAMIFKILNLHSIHLKGISGILFSWHPEKQEMRVFKKSYESLLSYQGMVAKSQAIGV